MGKLNFYISLFNRTLMNLGYCGEQQTQLPVTAVKTL